VQSVTVDGTASPVSGQDVTIPARTGVAVVTYR
jgi:hypothetical protein